MEPVKYGSRYSRTSGAQYDQIVDPALNTNGVVLSTISLNGAKLYTGTVKPTFVTEVNIPLLAEGPAGASFLVAFPYPILLPAGYGLWVHGGNSGVARVSFDYLP
ncbi:hypothetical protein JFU58_10650 [Pseudomonas sp. TH34]|uniref:hypothetical protein n=1 Tax=Pseudomonas sp. TH34 TaxID=2796399 RepID=UPI001912BCC7|nr:hypothetical protein [Pseudomonas sp. TH34]MBK5408996.1 hypothetical protein [Pseudomonas sp. TH34]